MLSLDSQLIALIRTKSINGTLICQKKCVLVTTADLCSHFFKGVDLDRKQKRAASSHPKLPHLVVSTGKNTTLLIKKS